MYRYLITANQRYYRQHLWQIVLLLFGIMMGVAVIVAIDLVNESAETNFKLANERLQGRASHRIVGERAFSETLYVELKKTFDVIAAPVINSYAKDNADQGLLFQVIGIDPFMEARFRTDMGQYWGHPEVSLDTFIRSENGVFIDHSSANTLELQAGDPFQILTNHGVFPLKVLSLIGAKDDPRFDQLIVADIGLAQQLAELPGKLSYIELMMADDLQLQAISNWLPPHTWIETPSEQQRASQQLTQAFQLNLSMLSLLALAVGLFLVYNTVSFSLLQRTPMLAQFRILGLTTAHIRNYLLVEYAMFSALGAALGILLGIAMAYAMMGMVSQTISDLYVATPVRSLWILPLSIAKGLLVGIVGCLLACWLPYRTAAQTSAIRHQHRVQQELTAQSIHRVQWQASVMLFMAVIVFSLWRGSGLLGGYIAIACLLFSMALITPAFISYSCQSLSRLLNRSGVATVYPILTMATRDSYRNLSRTGMASMALMVAIATAVGMNVMISSFRDSLESWLSQRLNADLYLARAYETPGETSGLPPHLIESLRNQPEVIAISTFRYAKTWAYKEQPLQLKEQPPTDQHREIKGQVKDQVKKKVKQEVKRKVSVIGAEIPEEGASAYRFLDGDEKAIWTQWQSEGWMIISESLANHLDVARGEVIHLNVGQQSTPFKVAGIYVDFGSDSGRALLTKPQFKTHWKNIPDSQMGVYLNSPESQPALVDRIQKRWGHILNLRFISSREILSLSLDIFERTFTITDILRLLAIIVAFSGVLSAFMGIQLERQSELRTLKALGFNNRELITLMLWQALLLGGLTGLLAAPVGVSLAWLLTEVINFRAFGWSIPLQLSGKLFWQAPLLALTASLLASIYPAWTLTRPVSVKNDQTVTE